MRLRVYGYVDHSCVVDEDNPVQTLATFYSGEYPFDHRAAAYHYKTLITSFSPKKSVIEKLKGFLKMDLHADAG
jgi:hypothetical protein